MKPKMNHFSIFDQISSVDSCREYTNDSSNQSIFSLLQNFSDIITQTYQILFMYDERIISYIHQYHLMNLPEDSFN